MSPAASYWILPASDLSLRAATTERPGQRILWHSRTFPWRSRGIGPVISTPLDIVGVQIRLIGWSAKQRPVAPIGPILTESPTATHPVLERIKQLRSQLRSMDRETYRSLGN